MDEKNDAPVKPCGGNEGIACSNLAHCEHCGWNPEVAKKRTENYYNTSKENAK